MAPPADLREWITLLEREGELVRIPAEVDPELEITEITDRTVKASGPALLFERVKGSDHSLLINQFGTEHRMCMAFDATSLDDVASKLSEVLEMQPPSGLVDKVRGLQKLKSIADSRPKTVRRAPSQEIVLEGDDASLDLLPIQKCWPGSCVASRSSSCRRRRSTSRCPRTPRSSSRATSTRTSSPRKGPSATTPGTTRRPSRSPSSGSPRSRCALTRSIRRSSSASR